jgi:transcriptional regulator with XRE-family HTH domain
MNRTMTETLKRTIRRSGESLYSVSAATGLNKSALGRFMAGKQSLRLDMADRLAAHFHLELTERKGR